MIIDSHTHINDPAFNNDPGAYIKEAGEHNVHVFLCIGSNLQTSKEAVEIAGKFPNVYASIGVHPSDVQELKDDDIDEFKKLTKNPKVIAIGEVGLDFFDKRNPSEETQIKWFKKFINLANETNLPIVVHSREATNLTYEILRDNKVNRAGIVHCYSAGSDYVKRYIELGYYFGIGGVVTFKNATSVKLAVQTIPLDRLLLETDAPYLAPTPYRGEINHSKYLPLIVKEIANLKNTTTDIIENTTTDNFCRLFGVKHS